MKVTRRSPDGGLLSISDGDREGSVRIVVRRRLEPREVPALPTFDEPAVVAAPWISPRTRQLLTDQGVGYVDDTGNTVIELQRPGLVIRTDGAQRDPNPEPSKGPTLRGPRAWSLLRTIAEVAPPYRVQDLADVMDIDAGYISRVLAVLADELLIERASRGPVTSVDWEGVLRKLTMSYSLFGSNDTSTWVSANGPEQFIADVASKKVGRWALSGSFAARAIAPVTAPQQAVIHTDDPERLAEAGHLLPATSGANVVLAVPYDPIVFTRSRTDTGVPLVSVAQVAMDALTGPGRMPSEGEAVLDWMRRNTTKWQSTSLEPED